MPRRLTNDLLIAAVLAQVLGGVLGWALPVDTARPLYDLHRALGVGILLLLAWKQAIALRSLRWRIRRADASIVWGSAAAAALLVTLGLGLAWTLNLISFDWLWGYSPLNVHVIVGIALVPFVGWHMLMRRRPNAASAPLRSRRALLRIGGLTGATLLGWQALEHLAPRARLTTGSKHAASFTGNAFPAEIWLFDTVPLVDSAQWRLGVLDSKYTLEELTSRHPQKTVRAVLDCTSGWWSEQVWSGVGVADVLRSAGIASEATGIACLSVTGHRIVLPIADVETAILATHVGGEPLTPGHGYPLRLVVPGRRGYHWVKWVARIDEA